ncbi:hypothetical protein SAMN05192529_11551 [Arachidicoccus rhizosphaerae]|uniref:Uncharacterized protein n=1 Tax=Arachidicoccus rhizosphaerae TaxID=551991 RepID=A0A1H4ALD7_9BACT|nr:hypothetical protein [Arachidicoccus rhizosphaerae]SEA36597.1 hypothetical protein SAMN05192529_11551 [Arachidicoccus rhizosphaerae]
MKKTVTGLVILVSGIFLFDACSKTPATTGQKIAPQEFISSTQLTITPGHASGIGINTVFTADGQAQTLYVDGATGQYFTIQNGDTIKAETPTVTMKSDHDYHFEIQFRGEDGAPSNDEYTEEGNEEEGANIHQFFFIPVATGSVKPIDQLNDDGDPLLGYVNLQGLEDHGGLDYQYADKSADGSKNLMIGLNGYFSIVKAGQSFDLVVDLRHGIQDKFIKNYPWYDADFSKADNDVNAPYGATDFATLFHLHIQTIE